MFLALVQHDLDVLHADADVNTALVGHKLFFPRLIKKQLFDRANVISKAVVGGDRQDAR